MQKQPLIDQILAQLYQAADAAALAADEAHQNATHAESAAETQYDTLGLENAYLAHGQSMRLEALHQAIAHYRQCPVRDFHEDDEISLGAVVELSNTQNQQLRFFLGTVQGGMQLHWHNTHLTLITPHSPVGQQLMGRYLEDTVELPGANAGHYTITALY